MRPFFEMSGFGQGCKHYRSQLVPYSRNTLSAEKAARLDVHLAKCPACRAELAMLQEVGGVLRGCKPFAPEPALDLWRRVEAQLIREQPRSEVSVANAPTRAPRARLAVPAAGLAVAGLAAAGLAAAALLFVALARPGAQPAGPPVAEVALSRPPLRRAPMKAARAAPARVKPGTGREDPFLPVEREAPRRLATKPPVAVVVRMASHNDSARLPRTMPRLVKETAAPYGSHRRRDRTAPDNAARVVASNTRVLEAMPDAPMPTMPPAPTEPPAALREMPRDMPEVTAAAERQPFPTPMQSVPATASAVESALDSERNLDLFRYSAR